MTAPPYDICAQKIYRKAAQVRSSTPYGGDGMSEIDL